MSLIPLWPNIEEDPYPAWPNHSHDWFDMVPWRRHTRPRQQRQSGGERWSQAVDMSGFNCDDVSVKKEGNCVIVHGKHEFEDGENVEKMERRRMVTLPANVNVDAVTTSFSRNGQLIIQAPLKDAKPPQELVDASVFGNHDVFGNFPHGFRREGDEVKLRMDLSVYKPGEINVRVDHHYLKVHAKHEDDHSFRESRQSVLLPRGMDESLLVSALSPAGILTFTAPALEALPDSGRTLAIESEQPMSVEGSSPKQ